MHVLRVIFFAAVISQAVAEESFRFIAIGDLGDPEHYKTLSSALSQTCRDYGCDTILTLGDNFYSSRSQPQETDGVRNATDPRFNRLEAIFHDVDVPVYWIPGNHDYGTSGGWEPELQVNAEYQVKHRQSRYWNMPGRYYSKVFTGPSQCTILPHLAQDQSACYLYPPGNMEILLLALDSTPMAQYRGKHVFIAATLYDEIQGKWVDDVLTRTPSDWKIVIAHHPLLSKGRPVPATKLYREFIQTHVCDRAHLFLSGHSHTLEWLWPENNECGNTELFVSGAGSLPAEQLRGRASTHFAQAGYRGYLHFSLMQDKAMIRFFILNEQSPKLAYRDTIPKPLTSEFVQTDPR